MSGIGLRSFIDIWCHPNYAPQPVEAADLAKVEAELGLELPAPYKTAVLAYGLPSPTIELLGFICDHEVDLPDLSDFHTPEELVSSTLDWREMGMPGNFVAFANDCSGNQFAFKTSATTKPDEVWFFDHDFGTSEKVADGFEEWLSFYNTLKS